MKLTRWPTAMTLSAALLAALPAAAQPKPPASAAAEQAPVQKTQAQAYVTAGNRDALAGRWDDAYAEYAIAWRLYQDWQTAAAVGKSAYRIKLCGVAIQALTYYLREAPRDHVSKTQATEAERSIETCKASVGYLAITAPAGVDILVDGAAVGKAPLGGPVPVDPGKHDIEARVSPAPQKTTATIALGKTREITFGEKDPTSPASPVGSSSRVGRTVALAGGVAATVAGAVVGGVFIGIAGDRGAERQKAALDPEGRDRMRGFARAEADARNIAFWGFVGAGLFAAGTTALYVTTRSPDKAQVAAGIGVQDGGPAVWVKGRF